MKNLSLRNLNNCFTLAVAIESRQAVQDMLRGTLGDVGLPLPETTGGWVTIGILETQTPKLTIGMLTRGTLTLVER